MKVTSLQFGKAMSAALFVLLLNVVGTKNALAQTQIATLQHDEDISVFYGQNAFAEAHTAAVDGDIITLSSGTFTSTSITKAITLRGAGCAIDTVTGVYPTVIIGNSFNINVASSTPSLSVEGISFRSEIRYRKIINPRFIKCQFETFLSTTGEPYNSANGVMQNGQFVNCIIKANSFSPYVENVVFINSVIWNLTVSYTTSGVLIRNSFFQTNGSLYGITVFNSILVHTSSNYQPDASCSFYNCIGIKNGYSELFSQQINNTNMTVETYSDVFETFNGSTFSFDEQYILKEEIANGFLGEDGTQVGIHGGVMPYNPRPTHMVVKHCNVANKSTVDGKLSVEIEVYTEDE